MSNPEQQGADEYINADEVAEEVIQDVDGAEPIDEDDMIEGGVQEIDPQNDDDDDYDDDNDVIEIDMSNNSWTYFDDHKDSIFKIAGHPKLPVVVTGGGDNVAYIWTTHLQPPKIISTITGHTESVIAGGFTNDGDYVITGDMTGKVIIYKSFKKGQLWKLHGEVETVEEITWIDIHPTQPVFAFGATDGSVWVYQISPEITQIMSGFSHSTECTSGKFVNTGDMDNLQLLTCSEDSSIIQWNCFANEQTFKFQSTDYKGEVPPWVSIAVENDLNIAALGSRDGSLFVYNTKSGNIIDFFKAIELKEDQDIFDASIEALSWCAGLSILAVGLVSGDLFFFDAKTWKLRRSIKFSDAITKVEFVNKGHILIVSCLNGKIYKLDVREGKELFIGTGHNMGVLDFVVQDNGNKLITAGDEGVSLIFKTDN
ncbi:Sqt1 protein [Saccharomycopsis crataegensis]|uniref:Sqt1 protein n=1 Tax=Saccharomycopsis crataegensis TaxID=43959 RepID=A0AAV5QIC3_9ASCO|nr:Sqt1 protein [Saccharomycopsis crataegensis]